MNDCNCLAYSCTLVETLSVCALIMFPFVIVCCTTIPYNEVLFLKSRHMLASIIQDNIRNYWSTTCNRSIVYETR